MVTVNAIPDPDTVPFTGAGLPGEVIHGYSIGLRGERWLTAEYVRLHSATGRGFGWRFTRGGKMRAEDWGAVIASRLPYIGRFGGLPYSVARHSVLMRWYLRSRGYGPGAQLLALLHDASECLGVGDMNTYLKKLIGQQVRSYEDDLLAFLLNDLGLTNRVSDADHTVVHATDKVFGETEARLLDMQNGQPWRAEAAGPVWEYLKHAHPEDTSPEWTRRDFLSAWEMNWAEIHG